MTWKILRTNTFWSDLDLLSERERLEVLDELFRWVDAGPPCKNRASLIAAELFEDDVLSKYRVTYFVHTPERYVAILRVRKFPSASS